MEETDMQYYIVPEKLQAALAHHEFTTSMLLDHIETGKEEAKKLFTSGGPTRDLHLINQICDYLSCFREEFSLSLREEGDDQVPPRDHSMEPLCFDVSKFQTGQDAAGIHQHTADTSL